LIVSPPGRFILVTALAEKELLVNNYHWQLWFTGHSHDHLWTTATKFIGWQTT
jgi:hypothetical protein